MLLHSIVEDSTVNGPGHRVVVWFQGCRNMGGKGKGCKGCWNPDTHLFDTSKETNEYFIAGQICGTIMKNKNITGVTFSGGEPLQQPDALLRMTRKIKEFTPHVSLGLFTGYTLSELETNVVREYSEYAWDLQEARSIWHLLKPSLDWAAMGRYVWSRQSSDEPLIGSSNQKLHLFTNRYTLEDFLPQQMEVTINESGLVQITGFPPENYLEDREV